MPKLWIWDNGDSAVLDMPPLGNGQWVENCKFCGDVPTVIHTRTGAYIFCVNTDCINNKQYPIERWNQNDCPYCESPCLTRWHMALKNNIIKVQIKCDGCQKTWFDIYTLTSIEEIK